MDVRRLVVVTTLALAVPLVGPAAGAAPGDGGPQRPDRPAVLARAEAIFDGDPTTQPGATPPGRTATSGAADTPAQAAVPEPTMVLRDLARSLDRLDGADRRRAERLLARPDTDGPASEEPLGVKYSVPSVNTCTDNVCVHWVRSTSHAPPDPTADVPAQVTRTAATFEEAWTALVDEGGYRAPLDDGDSEDPGPDGRLDVYLADIGGIAPGYFGFCTSDDPQAGSSRTVSAYCVVDDDFSTTQFGSGSDPLVSLQVTAAHEFFHAVQFGYDFWEELWFMEGTAAWAEELVYDDADDNRRYLGSSQLNRPWLPLDRVRDNARYGSWIFWQFLTEYVGAPEVADPTVVRQVWERAAGRRGPLRALDEVLAERVTTFAEAYAGFGVANLVPEAFYEEGGEYRFRAPLTWSRTLTADRPRRRASVGLDHLTTAYHRFRPGTELRARRLRVSVDLPPQSRRPAATALVRLRDGQLVPTRIPLDAGGAGAVTVPFASSSVADVTVVLSNAGTFDDQTAVVSGAARR